jgi:sarcosine oxidase subunit alpha
MSVESVEIVVDGTKVAVAPGTTVAAAMLNAGASTFRTSVSGEPRGPLCGMGICFECRVTVDGAPHRRACLVVCANGMRVDTGSAR